MKHWHKKVLYARCFRIFQPENSATDSCDWPLFSVTGEELALLCRSAGTLLNTLQSGVWKTINYKYFFLNSVTMKSDLVHIPAIVIFKDIHAIKNILGN